MSEVVARVAWSIGQVLLPEHFRALEASLIADADVRSRLDGLPGYGLLALDWNGPSPRAGVVEVSTVRWITSDGILVDLPGNARSPSPLALAPLKSTIVGVYLHLLDADPDERPASLEAASPNRIRTVMHRLALAADSRYEGSRGYLKLGDLSKTPIGVWTLSAECVPPHLSLTRTSYFKARLEDLRVSLEAVDSVFAHQNLSPDQSVDRRVAISRARTEVRRLSAILADVLAGGVDLHPYIVFGALRDFLLEIEPLQAVRASPTVPAYDHSDPGACFGALLTLIEQQLAAQPRVTSAIRLDREVFDTGEAWLACRMIPEQVFAAQAFYLLVQRRPGPTVASMRGATLAAPSRLARAVEYRLTTLQLFLQTDSPLSRAVGAAVDVYYIDLVAGAAEWAHVIGGRALALFAPELPDDVQVYLYWTAPRAHEAAR